MENIDRVIRTLEELTKFSGHDEVQTLKRKLLEDSSNIEANSDEQYDLQQLIGDDSLQAVDRLGKKMKVLNQQVNQLASEPNNVLENGEVDAFPNHGGMPMSTTKLVSQERVMEEIWTCIMNKSVMKLGVLGLVGSGKTTIAKQINNLLKGTRETFYDVILVTGTFVFNVVELQHKIACQLGVDIRMYGDPTTRAKKLYAAFQDRNKYVLILDDTWHYINLENIGIPEPTRANGCKLIFTTISTPLCYEMQCDVIIKIPSLSYNDALYLFLDHVGCDVLLNENLVILAEAVVAECNGWLLAIILIARSMRCIKEAHEWKNALQQLRVYSRDMVHCWRWSWFPFEFSYERLSEKQKDCLQYCALYPNCMIKEQSLIELLISEGILEGQTRKEQLDEGRRILTYLEYVHLLESATDGSSTKWMNMRKVVRDALEVMTSTNALFMARVGRRLTEIPEQNLWSENLLKVSLMDNNISEIPATAAPRCPQLSTLFLQYNPLTRISNSFFKYLPGLKVLNVSHTEIRGLPYEITSLVNLVALLARDCNSLVRVPPLGGLNSLRTLDFAATSIKCVPKGMEDLTDLRYLNLKTRSLKEFPLGILPKLSRLQYLALDPEAAVTQEEIERMNHLETFEGKVVLSRRFDTLQREEATPTMSSTFNQCIFFISAPP